MNKKMCPANRRDELLLSYSCINIRGKKQLVKLSQQTVKNISYMIAVYIQIPTKKKKQLENGK